MKTLSKLVMAAACTGFAALPAAADGYWEYRDWRVFVDEYDTGEDLRRNCTAMTGGDGLPSLKLHISNGDGGPPDYYPAPTFHESAPRGHSTQVQNGQALGFIFDNQAVFYAIADGSYDDEGFAYADASPRWQDTLNMLLWMQAGHSLEIRTVQPYGAGEQVLPVSLNGFTAAYGKMMDECGFSIALPRS
jgi:hypothetical protein